MNFLNVLILSVVQGLAELLPVSSSAHVIAAEKLMGLDPSSPQMTFLLVMLHTGTMIAVIVAFWSRWKTLLSREGVGQLFKQVVVATAATGVVGYGLKIIIEKFVLGSEGGKAEIEQLFANMNLIAAALATAGALILIAGLIKRPRRKENDMPSIAIIGVVQGLCLPFRGFSRSGATISTTLLRGLERGFAEDFSFLLAVVLTPPVVARELMRLLKERQAMHEAGIHLSQLLLPGLVGMVFSFVAGLLAIRWLSKWLETGRWYLFGIYCLVMAAVIAGGHAAGVI